ncbi:MAG: NAD+ synthase [Chloroflexi bacterium]|nr:NAD+ synthase [Chloroflexota bacterium]
MRLLRVALAQTNPTVGDLAGNTQLIIDRVTEARRLGADLVAFPELCLTGYPPEDLLLKPSFVRQAREHLDQVIAASSGIVVVVGFAEADGSDMYNAAAIISDGKLVDVYRKIFLPNYSVFDEDRYFRAGDRCPVYRIGDVTIGVNICEDIWYASGPTAVQRASGAEVIVNINGSPYSRGKRDVRHRMLATRAADNNVFVCYVNLVGGQDELVFDGGSVIFDSTGALVTEGRRFDEDLVVADLDVDAVFTARLHDPRLRKMDRFEPQADWARGDTISVASHRPLVPDQPMLGTPIAVPPMGPAEEVYRALVLGTRDYVRKSGFEKVVIGLSGGIDSALTAVIAADALGPENVTGVAMPSAYSSEGSVKDAAALATNIGIGFRTIPIAPTLDVYRDALADTFAGLEEDTTEENLQARIRGNLLMALSNKFGWLVLTTGNKSEYATGYATLYGDMAGGYAVIKDVPKTLVYEVSEYRNLAAGRHLIPREVMDKPPSAELRPGQLDTDSLPPYSVLDPVLEAYVERDRSPQELIDMGFDEAVVRRVVQLVDRSEYKRRQAPPGVRITPRAFGKDRRLPIVNRYRPI